MSAFLRALAAAFVGGVLLHPHAASAAFTFGAAGTCLVDTDYGGGSVSYPSGITAGQLLLLKYYIRDSSTDLNVPSGWTNVASVDGTRVGILGKVATGSESGSLALTFANGDSNMIAQIARFETGATGWSISVHASSQTSASGVNDIPTPSLTVSEANTLVVALGGATHNMSPYSPPSGFTEPSGADCGNSGAFLSMAWGYQIQTTATNISASNFDGTGSTTGNTRSIVASLPAPAGGGGGGALTRTDFAVTSDLNGVGTGAFSTASFTPANNSLQVVAVYASAANSLVFQGSDLTLTNSAGLTCTQALTSPTPIASTWGHGFRVWTCPVTTGTSMTFSADAGTYDIHQYVIERFQYTGYHTSTPTGATAAATDACAGNNANCPVTISLSAAPASTSEVLAFTSVNGGCNTCSPSPGSGWTEVHDIADAGQSWGNYQSQVRGASTSTSVTWANLNAAGSSPDGAVLGALEIRASSGGGGDTTAPTITITAPADNAFTNNPATVITGTLSEVATLTINGVFVPSPSNSFSYTTALSQGANIFALAATDAASNTGNKSLTINLDTVAPAAPNSAYLSLSAPSGGQVTVTGQAGAVEANASVRVRNLVTGAVVVVVAAANGSFSAVISAATSDTVLVEAIDAAGNTGQATALGGGGETTFVYDELGRLRNVTSPRSSATYNYDAAGNRSTVAITKN